MNKFETVILIPVFNDWHAFTMLVEQIENTLDNRAGRVCVIVVNDGSSGIPIDRYPLPKGEGIRKLDIIHLRRNIGHQRAIAIGLSHIQQNVACSRVVVMDSDGEDQPGDIGRLIDASRENPEDIIFASRTKRSEGIIFRSLYLLYKAIFRLLTGIHISFGNFCLIPSAHLDRLVFISEIWNHFAAGVIRSRIPISIIPTSRGVRLAGHPKMNLTSLVAHGLSAVSVFLDTLATKLTILSISLILLTGAGFLIVVGIRFLTDLAIPGWATTVAFGLAIIFMQTFTMSVLFIFVILSYRTQKTFIPCLDYRDYVLTLETLRSKELGNK